MLRYQGQRVRQFGLDSTGQIDYQFNQQGFRSNNNFDFVPDYAFFGCSMVFGIGVPIDQTFPYLFNNSQNYGVAGEYNNADTFILIKKFINSPLYSEHTKMAVIWHRRDTDNLEYYYQELTPYKILHFFCGPQLPHESCYPVFPNIDYDVSDTHYGPKSHRSFWRLLSSLFTR
jgi:hypothetical protein